MRPYTISFRYALVDFAGIEDNALSVYIRLKAFLMALKYVLRPDLPEHLGVLLAEGAQLPIVGEVDRDLQR